MIVPPVLAYMVQIYRYRFFRTRIDSWYYTNSIQATVATEYDHEGKENETSVTLIMRCRMQANAI